MVYARVEGNYVYYQIPWTSGSLSCKYGTIFPYSISFNENATYHGTYAECSPWSRGNPSYTITLTLNGNTYTTNETTAISNGQVPG